MVDAEAFAQVGKHRCAARFQLSVIDLTRFVPRETVE
jgi:hypothetical protein